ncbi:MAG: hypothetical protein JWQ03_626 [Variovorax sp.]|nr:hypothetical protein [Variovorax sp.]
MSLAPHSIPGAQKSDLDAQVLALLIARKGDWKRIAEESDTVSYSWISKFANGHIPNAGVDTLRKLRDWLEVHPVESPSAPAADDSRGDSSSVGAGSVPPG